METYKLQCRVRSATFLVCKLLRMNCSSDIAGKSPPMDKLAVTRLSDHR